ncbi:uncharacterized protein F5891DRAFT_986331 [Suillus fuscotomentosus]|uniref:KOW domain-containing protein n=1 Tax=Suillus fuscotomentosus TaxID=1912939 RepID=A0AAD4DS73_9AGAM|nr:uncharacterized protein F5891DRAFT_986331 [Suillus fuscotomentosus]KAG1892882.1 hypothetical protein F5891DRAFT_986331 [Suillus fuscotomentosus]
MSTASGKRALAAPSDDEPATKHVRINHDGNWRTPVLSPLSDEGSWCILEQFLTTEMTYPQMEEALLSHLGPQYSADDWKDARDALFSGDGNDSIALANLLALKARYMPQASDGPSKTMHPAKDSPAGAFVLKTDGYSSRTRNHRLRRRSNPFILDEAEEGDNEDKDEDEEGDGDGDHRARRRRANPFIDDQAGEDEDDSLFDNETGSEDGIMRLQNATCLTGPSAKDTLAVAIDKIFVKFGEKSISSSKGRLSYRAARFPDTSKSRTYLLHVHRTATPYIAEHLSSKGFSVIVSAWVPGQLLSMKQYLLISDEEFGVVKCSNLKLPNPSWVRIKHGKYKGDSYVFDSEQSTGFVVVLIPPREFPYSMPRGSKALLDRSRLPNDNRVSDIIHDEKVVGWSYKGERYYMGLLLKIFYRSLLELVASPHADDIRLHFHSGWDTLFVKKSIASFSMQFLRVGNVVRVLRGELYSKIGTVVSTDYIFGSVHLELTFDGHRKEIDLRLEDLECVFRVGDTVRVMAGSYLGVEGHIIQIFDDICHVCQAVSKEELQVSKYYLECCSLNHTLHLRLPIQQKFEPFPDCDSIQVGDEIKVLAGEHMGKYGVVEWFPVGDTQLWFRDANPIFTGDDISRLPLIKVTATFVQQTHIAQTMKFTRERGYDVRPGDFVSVARGPKYQTKGVVQSVDFRKAHLTLLSEGNASLIDVPIGFVMKLSNADLDSLKEIIGQEVFIVGGDRKGFRATLYGLGSDLCTVAVHGQARITLKNQDVVTSYGMRLNGAILEAPDLASFCEMRKRSYLPSPHQRKITPPPERFPPASRTDSSLSSPNMWTTWNTSAKGIHIADNPSSSAHPSLSTFDPWTLNAQDIQDNIRTNSEELRDSGPLPWLMSREFSSTFLKHHAVLKVSPSFMGGRLHKQFVFTAIPDPFCGANGPAPTGCISAFCTSNSAGAALQHYHIPAKDLHLAPPRKKNQRCLVLDGDSCGQIVTVAKCNAKKNTIDVITDLYGGTGT